MKIGVLSLQGDVREHLNILNKIGVEGVRVRTRDELEEVSGLIIPGGESTTIGKLLKRFNLLDIIREKIEKGLPVFGTCAGFILLAKEIEPETGQPRIGVLNVKIRRNAFGRQIDSHEVDLEIKGFDKPFHAVFIRAPIVEKVGENVEILSRTDRGVVFVRQKNILGASFHPELTEDTRIHEMFIKTIKERR
ncbi:MAG: pyridoxal 5'-phosphate synthase glutaminase subunit PdxT [Caldisericia bacterium]|nr:pyridoxal 5'-phosphate synthase glutaminase subunit PdxT [Caldisericia bacterium]